MFRFAGLMIVFISVQIQYANAETFQHDVVIYGGTCSAVTAAVQVKRMGKSVIIVSPDVHLGGLSSGGLGWTDSGNKATIGGLSREFYHRIWKHYDQPAAWKWQKKSQYGGRGQGSPAMDGKQRTMWIFEPSVAEKVFDQWVKEMDIPVHRDTWLDRENGVLVQDGKIQSIKTLNGNTYTATVFIDSTYEGDLMAAAGVSYHVGREASDVYGEDWNGNQIGVLHHKHWFQSKIDPYKTPGDPSSGLLPRISPDPPGEKGAGDQRVQAYCFRMCLTNVPENRVPFPKPDGYDPAQYELLLRVLDSGWRALFAKYDPIPNFKTDTNNHGPFSTDNIGMNYDYPEATYERRRQIIAEHETYQKGLLYFMANEPRVPKDVRDAMSKWGLAKDEFLDNGNWPHQIYVREARRLIGEYVMTENELLKRRDTPQSIGMGSYTMDSHNVRRYVTAEGFVQNEGDIGVKTNGPYEIALGSVLPKKDECTNLLVPVCVSSSHIAFGSIRMEPVFMILGQSAATVAVMSIDSDDAVQDIPYARIKERLLADGQVLEYEGGGEEYLSAKSFPGIIVDDMKAKVTGAWTSSKSVKPHIGIGYKHDSNKNKGDKVVVFETKLEKSGRYEVRLGYSASDNRASNVPVVVQHSGGSTTVMVDQRKKPQHDDLFTSLGTFEFTNETAASVSVSNQDTNGFVIVDAVQFLPAK